MRHHHWHRWTDEEDAQLLAARAIDQSYGDIGRRLGITGAAAYRRFAKLQRVRQARPTRRIKQVKADRPVSSKR